MYTISTSHFFALSHSPRRAPKTPRNVSRDDTAHGDEDDYQLFTFLDVQLSVYFNLAIHDATFQWPRGLRRLPADARFLGLRVLITPETWMSVCSESWVL
jgi:hypothetical protein